MDEMTGLKEIEDMLGRELGQVAGGVQVPPQPRAPGHTRRPVPRWFVPLAAAAAVLLLLVGLTVALRHHGDSTEPTTSIPKTLPQVPFAVGRTLYVDGKAMPGRWSGAVSAGDAWVAARKHGWFWGTGTSAHRVEVAKDAMPMLSADGKVLALAQRSKAGDRIRVLSTQTGKVLGTWHLDLGKVGGGSEVLVSAVTSPDIRVIVRTASHTQMWNLDDGSTHQLTKGLFVFWSTPAGLVISDAELHFHLGTIDDTGRVHLGAVVRRADQLTVSADGWSLRGEKKEAVHTSDNHDSVPTVLAVTKLDGSDTTTLPLPAGWGAVNFAWEGPGRVIGDGVPLEKGTIGVDQHRLIRCAVSLGRCAVIKG